MNMPQSTDYLCADASVAQAVHGPTVLCAARAAHQRRAPDAHAISVPQTPPPRRVRPLMTPGTVTSLVAGGLHKLPFASSRLLAGRRGGERSALASGRPPQRVAGCAWRGPEGPPQQGATLQAGAGRLVPRHGGGGRGGGGRWYMQGGCLRAARRHSGRRGSWLGAHDAGRWRAPTPRQDAAAQRAGRGLGVGDRASRAAGARGRWTVQGARRRTLCTRSAAAGRVITRLWPGPALSSAGAEQALAAAAGPAARPGVCRRGPGGGGKAQITPWRPPRRPRPRQRPPTPHRRSAATPSQSRTPTGLGGGIGGNRAMGGWGDQGGGVARPSHSRTPAALALAPTIKGFLVA